MSATVDLTEEELQFLNSWLRWIPLEGREAFIQQFKNLLAERVQR